MNRIVNNVSGTSIDACQTTNAFQISGAAISTKIARTHRMSWTATTTNRRHTLRPTAASGSIHLCKYRFPTVRTGKKRLWERVDRALAMCVAVDLHQDIDKTEQDPVQSVWQNDKLDGLLLCTVDHLRTPQSHCCVSDKLWTEKEMGNLECAFLYIIYLFLKASDFLDTIGT